MAKRIVSIPMIRSIRKQNIMKSCKTAMRAATQISALKEVRVTSLVVRRGKVQRRVEEADCTGVAEMGQLQAQELTLTQA